MKTDRPPAGKLTAGYNSTMKLIKNNEAAEVFVAYDCAPSVRDAVLSAAENAGIQPDQSRSMAQLGAMCGIDVGCAVCAKRK